MVCADFLAGLFALLAPLALLVFVPPVAVALLAVVPPPAAAANGRRRTKVCKGHRRLGRERLERLRKEIRWRVNRQGGKAMGRQDKKVREGGEG